jgi:outer membrane protein TolC
MTRRILGTVLMAVLKAATAIHAQQPPSRPPGGLAGDAFAGGVPTGDLTDQEIALTLGDAITRGLRHNLGVLLEEQRVQAADGERWHQLSGILPDVSASLEAAREKINLAAFGFTAPGIPQLVGPFNLYDARVRVSQAVVDMSALNDAAAGRKTLEAAKASYADTRSLVVAAITNLYLVAVADRSRVQAAEAAEATADAAHRLAVDQNAAGIAPKLDPLRADVELRSARQRSIVARNQLDKDKLALARAIGLPLGQAFTLADTVPFVPVPPVDLDSAVRTAYSVRDDFKSAQARVAAAEATARAASLSRLPTLTVDADYGAIGNTTSEMLATFSVAANVHVPIFERGSAHARSLSAGAELAAQRAEANDLRSRIYYEVKSASLDLAAAAEQVLVARESVDVADQALTQAEDRFKAGIANNLEVVQSQQALTSAREAFIASLYTHNVAKVALARAIGAGESEYLSILEGKSPWPTTSH